jgi:uncharacterized protein YjbJ (UPF0337 family)
VNWSQVEGQWKQVKAQVKSKWAKLNDDDLQNLSAKKDELVGKLQERYGLLKDEAERQVDAFVESLAPPDRANPRNPETRSNIRNPK